MTEEEFKKYLEAGRIAARAKEEAAKLVAPGKMVLDVAEAVEAFIRSLGGEPAFPVNISLGSVAAHYTPTIRDPSVFPERGLAKIDLGVHVDGYIVDTAITIDLGGDLEILARAAREALEEALPRISPGSPFREVGRAVEAVAKRYSLNVVRNLSGHRIERFKIHAGESIPNYPETLSPWRFREGGVYAVEPFITNGAGIVAEEKISTIYTVKKAKARDREEEKILREALARFKGLPFCGRWLSHLGDRVEKILEELAGKGALHRYPVLTEITGSQVAQFEETVVIYGGSVYVATRRG